MALITNDLWVPTSVKDQRAAESNFRKSRAPQLGNAYGVWAGRDLSYLNMPGGAVMAFDLTKLTLQDFRQMRDHYQVNMSLSILTFMMHGLDWHIDGGTSIQNAYVEDQIRRKWTELIRGMTQAYWAGYSPMVIDWENDGAGGRVNIDRVKDLVPEDCWVNWKTVEGVPSEPGNVAPKFYEYDGIVQAGYGGGPGQYGYMQTVARGGWTIPPENTIWYSLLRENGDYYGRKMLRPAFPSWFFSQLMHLFNNRYLERFGEPVPVGRADFEDEVQMSDGTYVSGREAMTTILAGIRNRSAIVLPSDRLPTPDGKSGDYAYDIQYLESQMRGVDFERYLTRLDEEISLAIWTPLLMTHSGAEGSHSLGETHTQIYLWMLNALGGDLKDALDSYVVRRLAKFNWGQDAANKMEFKFRALGKDNAEILRTLVSETLRLGYVKPNLEQLAQAVGIDFEDAEILNATVAAPAPAGGSPDTRQRQRPKVSSGVKKQVAARVARQLDKARRTGAPFNPDLGFRSQIAADTDLPQSAFDNAYARIEMWVRDVATTHMGVAEIRDIMESVVECELQDAIDLAA